MGEAATILGAGSWGTALAIHLAKKGLKVKLWARSEEAVIQLKLNRENKRYLPGVILPKSIEFSSNLEEALRNVKNVIIAVPSQGQRTLLQKISPLIEPETIIINTAKGLENTTCFRLSQVVAEIIPGSEDRYAILSGPSHSEEVSRGMPTAVVAASRCHKVAEYVQDLFMSPVFRVYASHDLLGVEFGGALKNIIALSTGVAEGLGYGDNTKAALITRGLTEIARLGVTLGANPLSFLGLAGVGDLIVTCTSRHSRNRRAGILLGKGTSLKDTLKKVGMVVEGVETAKAAHQLAHDYQVEMPITEQIFLILFDKLHPQKAVSNLMLRTKRHEVEDVFLKCSSGLKIF